MHPPGDSGPRASIWPWTARHLIAVASEPLPCPTWAAFYGNPCTVGDVLRRMRCSGGCARDADVVFQAPAPPTERPLVGVLVAAPAWPWQLWHRACVNAEGADLFLYRRGDLGLPRRDRARAAGARDRHRPYQSRSPGPPGAGFLAVLRLTIRQARRPDDPRPATGGLGMSAGEASGWAVFAST
jgi:hypothetical protein